ncbi:hypothetical protein D932_03581 [Enterococcus casseliflavus 14-MB-W-14]|nr:hypothetical protein D932_03581 [Enterococcus casseliflavus 14-MB-W-14]
MYHTYSCERNSKKAAHFIKLKNLRQNDAHSVPESILHFHLI